MYTKMQHVRNSSTLTALAFFHHSSSITMVPFIGHQPVLVCLNNNFFRRRGGGWPDGRRRMADGRLGLGEKGWWRAVGSGGGSACGRRRGGGWPDGRQLLVGWAAAPGRTDARHERGAGLRVAVWELRERRVRERRKERESKCFLVTSGSGG
jgi:hypothetical protein